MILFIVPINTKKSVPWSLVEWNLIEYSFLNYTKDFSGHYT